MGYRKDLREIDRIASLAVEETEGEINFIVSLEVDDVAVEEVSDGGVAVGQLAGAGG